MQANEVSGLTIPARRAGEAPTVRGGRIQPTGVESLDMPHIRGPALISVILTTLLLGALPGAGEASQRTTEDVVSAVTQVVLPDGLQVLLKEVHAAPVVCTYVWYRVGSRNEVKPITGISHQIEHMMFKGTVKEFPTPGYIDLLVGRFGGENNAETDTDTTSYYLLLPADQLDLALRIEADRMENAAMDAHQLTAENRVVLSELEGDENDNSYFLYENLRAAAYRWSPYHFPVIGTRFDVVHLTRAEVYSYYRDHYAPNNATLVVVGDFSTATVLARIRALWATVPRRPITTHPIDPEPPQRGERRVLVRRAGTNSYLDVAYHIPACRDPDLPSLTVLATALATGHSSRLYRALVETQLATDVQATASTGVDPELFEIDTTIAAGGAPNRTEPALLAEIARVASSGLESHELQQAKNETRAQLIFGQDSVEDLASRLGYYQSVFGSWTYVNTFLASVNAVTSADAARVARKYLTADNRTVGLFVPNGEAPTPAAEGGSKATHYRSQPRPSAPGSVTILRGAAGREQPAVAGPVERRLANGVTVIVQENHANPTVSIGGFIRTGSVRDPQGRFGLAALTAAMLTRGTTTRTSRQIASALDFVSAQLTYSADRERTLLAGQMLSHDFDSVLALVADTLENPAFDQTELERARAEALAHIAADDDDTGAVATRGLYGLLYPPDDPFRHMPEGTQKDVGAITRGDCEAFYRRCYRPDRVTIVIVGDVLAASAFAAADRLLASWHTAGEASPQYQPHLVSAVARAAPPVMVPMADKSQDDIAMGSLGISREASDYEAAYIMNLILGGDEFVGRVGRRVRDVEGLAYYAITGFVSGLAVGPWEFRAGASPANVIKAVRSADEEVDRMALAGVTPAELAWAKDHAIGTLSISMATNAGIVTQIENDAFYHLGLDYPRRYPKLIRALTKPQVDAASRKYLHPSGLDLVVTGPPVQNLADLRLH